MSRIDYRVPGLMRVVAQPDPKSCWAAAATMMISWRYQMGLEIETALARAGGGWLEIYNRHYGLDPRYELDVFVTACGMTYEPLQSCPPEQWLEMLEAYGPLAVVTQQATFHARVLWGMQGELDATGRNLTLRIADPDRGRWVQEPFPTFSGAVERAARIPRAQVWHWPARR